MTIEILKSFLGWCAVLNIAMLMWWFLWLVLAHDAVYRLQTKWFKISPEQFDALHYGCMAYYKLTIIILNIVPYFALCIIG